MSQAAPSGALCMQHPTVAAVWACGRCGAFFCGECERRTRPDALPMCPACWTLRAQQVKPVKASSGTALQTTGLVLGALAMIPCLWPVQLASLIVNILALVRAKDGPARAVRRRAVIGLALTGLGVALDVISFVALR